MKQPDRSIVLATHNGIKLLCGDRGRNTSTGEIRVCDREKGHTGFHCDRTLNLSWQDQPEESP